MQVKIDAISEAADLDYMKRRIEALYYEVKRFGSTLIVVDTTCSMGSCEAGFQLAALLHNNSGLVKYTVDEESSRRWEKVTNAVKHEV